MLTIENALNQLGNSHAVIRVLGRKNKARKVSFPLAPCAIVNHTTKEPTIQFNGLVDGICHFRKLSQQWMIKKKLLGCPLWIQGTSSSFNYQSFKNVQINTCAQVLYEQSGSPIFYQANSSRYAKLGNPNLELWTFWTCAHCCVANFVLAVVFSQALDQTCQIRGPLNFPRGTHFNNGALSSTFGFSRRAQWHPPACRGRYDQAFIWSFKCLSEGRIPRVKITNGCP